MLARIVSPESGVTNSCLSKQQVEFSRLILTFQARFDNDADTFFISHCPTRYAVLAFFTFFDVEFADDLFPWAIPFIFKTACQYTTAGNNCVNQLCFVTQHTIDKVRFLRHSERIHLPLCGLHSYCHAICCITLQMARNRCRTLRHHLSEGTDSVQVLRVKQSNV